MLELMAIGEKIAERRKTLKLTQAKEHPEFAEIGQRMLEAWETGINASLRS